MEKSRYTVIKNRRKVMTVHNKEIGKTVFLTKAEAEQKLKEVEI